MQNAITDVESMTETDILNMSRPSDTNGTYSDELTEKAPVLLRSDTEQPEPKSRKKKYKEKYEHAKKSPKQIQKQERKKKSSRIKFSEIKQDHVCDICNKTYSTKNSLKLHRRIHSGERDFVCTTCGRAFQRYHHLSSHELTHQGTSRSKSYICDTCGKRYVEKRALRDHMAIHKGVQEYFCDICGNGFWHKTGLRKHVNQVHLRTFPTDGKGESAPINCNRRACTCEICGKTLADASVLKRHTCMYIHTGEKEASCSICKKQFMTKNSYKRHVMRKHNPLKVDKTTIKSCSICNKEFTKRRYYLDHVIRKHNELRVKGKTHNLKGKAETEDIIVSISADSQKVDSDNGEEDENEVLSLSVTKSSSVDKCSGDGVSPEKPANKSTVDNIRHADNHPSLDYTVSKIKTEVVFSEEEDTIPYSHSPTEIKTEPQEFDTSFNIPSLLGTIVDKSSSGDVKVDASGIKVAVSFGPDNFPSVHIKDELDDFGPMGIDADDDHLEPMEADL